MRVLVTWGSKMGGTAGIGEIVAETLREHAFDVVAAPVEEVRSLEGYDAAIVGGGLYANRWVAGAHRFVNRNAEALRKMPVWLFSSGPLDDSADRTEIPPATEVAVLAERVGAIGHVTFGGRLEADAKGFPASAMAKTNAGDWRNPTRIRGWAEMLAERLPSATPGTAIDHPARAWPRLALHGAVAWGLSAATLVGLLEIVGRTPALVLHALLAPAFFAVVAWHYFRARGARDALPTAVVWIAIAIALDLTIAGALGHGTEMLRSFTGTWLPLGLGFLATWLTGALMATLPWPKPGKGSEVADPTARGAH